MNTSQFTRMKVSVVIITIHVCNEQEDSWAMEAQLQLNNKRSLHGLHAADARNSPVFST